MSGERWNHNIHCHRLIVNAVPRTARSALDVGCGEGTLCRALRERVPHVVGLDADPGSIELARAAGGEVEYVLGDFLAHEFTPQSFDLVASVATLHHLDVEAALVRMRDLLRPGGVLALVGLARRSHADLPYDVAGFFAHRLLKLRHGYWEHPSPITDPTMTHRELRKVVTSVLPAARYRRHILFRFSVVWTKPSGD
ncbi:MAG TPA: class I SAM-dependent methyltransferase [Kineosporiaceae bacterium]|nr:class I SAM-dependent methyltransferase [Kineosporiaceae bacterium]